MEKSFIEITRKIKLVFIPNFIDDIIYLDTNPLYAKKGSKPDDSLYKRLYKWYDDWYVSEPKRILYAEVGAKYGMLIGQHSFYCLWMLNKNTMYASRITLPDNNSFCNSVINDLKKTIYNTKLLYNAPQYTIYRIV